jgi:hypothetical protein
MNAVDTNVFVYFFDREEPSKQAQATELLDRLVQPPTEFGEAEDSSPLQDALPARNRGAGHFRRQVR